MRSLTTYNLLDLYDLDAQGKALLPTLCGAEETRMVDLLATLAGEIADRRGASNLAAAVCGYGEEGELLDAKQGHTFPRVRHSSRR